jgi:hypothetical protein
MRVDLSLDGFYKSRVIIQEFYMCQEFYLPVGFSVRSNGRMHIP